MLNLLTILTLIAPIPSAVLISGMFARVLLPRWDRRAEVATFARRMPVTVGTEIGASRSEPEPVPQVA